MSTPGKTDPARAALFLAKLVADDEAKRIEGLSDDEYVAELKRKDRDPSHEISTEALLEKVTILAAQPGQAVGSEHATAPRTPGASPARTAPAVTPMRRRPSRVVWLLAAALGVAIAAIAAIAILAFERRQYNVASGVPWPTPREMAETLRDEAVESCEKGAWAACKGKLDEAARLDPAGESEERVQKARGEIEKAGR